MQAPEVEVHAGSGNDVTHQTRDYKLPVLCVIDENGCEIAEPDVKISEPSNYNDAKYKLEALRDRDCNAERNNNVFSECADDNDLSQLKATTARLKLTTRRQSYVVWHRENMDKFNGSATKYDTDCDINWNSENVKHFAKNFIPTFDNTGAADDTLTDERKLRINEALAWIRNELQEMRSQDEVLARQLLSIRHDIQQLKLQRSCAEHRDMLDDVTLDIEETHELHEICDIPIMDSVNNTPLRHLGVTRMHLSARQDLVPEQIGVDPNQPAPEGAV